MVNKIKNTLLTILLVLIVVSLYSCEKNKLVNEREIAKEQLNGTWIINKVETNTESIIDNGDMFTIEIWNDVKNGNNGSIVLTTNNITHAISMGSYGISGDKVIKLSLDVDWTSSLLSNILYSNFNTGLEINVNSKQLIIIKNIQTTDGIKKVLTISASKQ